MKDAALLLGVLIILSGVGWYLFNTTEVAVAPVVDETGEELPPNTDWSTTTPGASNSTAPGAPSLPSAAIDSFSDCVAAGNPVMESYPRQCRHNGVLFIEEIDDEPVACTMDAKICPDGSAVGRTAPNCEFAPCPGESSGPAAEQITCSPESKLAEACTMEYAPVCGLVEVQCVTTPCNPIPETFSNACMACAQQNVVSFSRGACVAE